jgi:hypothetical protein
VGKVSEHNHKESPDVAPHGPRRAHRLGAYIRHAILLFPAQSILVIVQDLLTLTTWYIPLLQLYIRTCTTGCAIGTNNKYLLPVGGNPRHVATSHSLFFLQTPFCPDLIAFDKEDF